MPGSTIRNKLLELGIATAIYVAITFGILYPLFMEPANTELDISASPLAGLLVGQMNDLYAWSLTDATHSLGAWLQGQPTASHLLPEPRFVASSQAHWGHLPIFAPLIVASGNPVLATQLTMLLNFSLTAACLFLLARHFGLSRVASLLAGLIYAFGTVRLRHLAQPGLIAGQYLPIALLCIDALVRGRRLVGASILLTLALVLQMLCAAPFVVATIPLTILFAVALCFSTDDFSRHGVGSAMLAIAAAWLVTWVVLSPTSNAISSAPQIEALARIGSESPTGAANLISAPPVLRPWENHRSSHLGWTALFLVLLSVPLGSSRNSPIHRARWGGWGLLLGGALLAIGPSIAAAGFSIADIPYRMARFLAPGYVVPLPEVPALSTAGHFPLLVAAAWALLAGCGLERLRTWLPRPVLFWPIAVAAITVAGWEYGLIEEPVPVRYRPVERAVSNAYRMLAQMPPGTVLEIPTKRCSFFAGRANARYQNNVIYHRHPVLNGHLQLDLPSRQLTDALIGNLPNSRSIELLQRYTNLRYVLVHLDTLDPPERERWRTPQGLDLVEITDQTLLFVPTANFDADLMHRLTTPYGALTTLGGTPLQRLQGAQVRADLDLRAQTEAAVNFPFLVDVAITNTSDNSTWPSLAGDGSVVGIGYRWLDQGGQTIVEHLDASKIPDDLEPGESTVASVCIQPPPGRTGNLSIEAGLTQNGSWLGQLSQRAPVEVRSF